MVLEQIEKGRKLIEDMGGEAAYDAEARRRRRQTAPKADLLKDHGKIVFDDS